MRLILVECFWRIALCSRLRHNHSSLVAHDFLSIDLENKIPGHIGRNGATAYGVLRSRVYVCVSMYCRGTGGSFVVSRRLMTAF
ncbi:unnamed protein product [Macrosiphum euphorbiae]|uniref:Secreted protein n=1 Tax=Macrosiphum euphorbiae TaxID=13131 RepID=A0AAV0WG84_9HEMI|nr:unnamed protein product [Macrosiphum euphorbiae]